MNTSEPVTLAPDPLPEGEGKCKPRACGACRNTQEAIPRYAAIAGLGFGDCGKGAFVDALTRRWQAHTIVRFNGGAQAGHNVVLPDGRHHTFSQFSSGSFVAGTQTVLIDPMVVHPSALLIECAFLERAGVRDALSRLQIDGRCRINTPFHQAAGRLRERLRGHAAHGTCGIGFGETVDFGLRHPECSLRYADLFAKDRARETAEAIRRILCDEMKALCGDACDDLIRNELALLESPDITTRWLDGIAPLLENVRPSPPEALRDQLLRDGTVLFEGAQGALLDEDYGFHPHTTWSTTRLTAASAVLDALDIQAPILKLGVLRSYLTRHGAGPFPTHDPALAVLAEQHNDDAGWQGRFRRGYPDLVLLRYACQISGPLDGLLLSHLDVFDSGHALRVCNAYSTPERASSLTHLPVIEPTDLPRRLRLTEQLRLCTPCYESEAWTTADDCIARVADTAGCPVRYRARGPGYQQIQPEQFGLGN